MNLKSPLFDKVRVKPPSEEGYRPGQTRCQFPGCTQAGEFRAPMGRFREGQYFCFCLDHVREYNLTYDYFRGMSAEAIAQFQRDALVGHRPTWTTGVVSRNGGAFDAAETWCHPDKVPGIRRANFRRCAYDRPQPRYGVAALKALDQLGLDDSVDMVAIKARYKDLVKRWHPDANAGDRSNEDKLREIIRAYSYLKSSKHV
jgi:hypothetical protein